MTWVRLDDNFSDHPKVARAGDAAAWLWVCGLAYCSRHLTDGFIPEAVIPRLTGLRRPQRHVERLVQASLWERIDGGYRVHDYLQFQFSSGEIRERQHEASLARREAGRLGGIRSGETRRSKAKANVEATAPNIEATAKQNPSESEANPKQNEAPCPSQLRSPNGDLFAKPASQAAATRSKPAKTNEANVPIASDYRRVIDMYWDEYGRATGKKPVIGPKEGKAAKNLLRVMSAEDACETIRAAFRDDWFRKTGLELYQIANSPNRWRGSPPSQARPRATYVDPRRMLQPAEPNAEWRREFDEHFTQAHGGTS